MWEPDVDERRVCQQDIDQCEGQQDLINTYAMLVC